MSSNRNFGGQHAANERDNSLEQYRLARIDNHPPQLSSNDAPLLDRVSLAPITYSPTPREVLQPESRIYLAPPVMEERGHGPLDQHRSGVDQRLPVPKPPSQSRQSKPEEPKPRVDLTMAQPRSNPAPPRSNPAPPEPPRINNVNNVVPVKPRHEHSKEETIFIDEPDNYPPLYQQEQKPRQDEPSRPRPLYSSQEDAASQGQRADPKTYLNEHLRREAFRKQRNGDPEDLHSVRRSHSRKQDQTIRALLEEKEALQKLLQKMIKQNQRNSSPEEKPDYISPNDDKSREQGEARFESQQKPSSGSRRPSKDAIPTKKKEPAPQHRSDSMQKENRQSTKPPKSRTRLDPERVSREPSPSKKPKRGSSTSSEKKRPLNDPKHLKYRDLNSSPGRKSPFDISKNSEKTEWELYSPFLDRYGGRYPDKKYDDRYSPSKNPFLNYPAKEANRKSQQYIDPPVDEYHRPAGNYKRSGKADRSNCLYCVDHENHLGHSPRKLSHAPKEPLPREAAYGRNAPFNFSSREELYFEGKLFPISNSNSPRRPHY